MYDYFFIKYGWMLAFILLCSIVFIDIKNERKKMKTKEYKLGYNAFPDDSIYDIAVKFKNPDKNIELYVLGYEAAKLKFENEVEMKLQQKIIAKM